MRRVAASLIGLLVSSGIGLVPALADVVPSPVVAAYYGGNVSSRDVPAGELTDLIYAFAEPASDGTCHSFTTGQAARFSELRALRAAHPGLRLLISIGGWGAAPSFSDAASTLQSREAFARTCVAQYVKRAGFDGIDLDWEFPVRGGVPQNPHRPKDRANVTLLLAQLRQQLDALARVNHRPYVLTVATPAGTWQYGGAYSPADSYDLASVAKTVDWLNVMTYDMNTIFSPVSGFNAPMYADAHDPTPAGQRNLDTVTGAVRFYESRGVPPGKIVLGMALYGRGFVGVSSRDAGLYSKYSGIYPETPWKVVKAKYSLDPRWQKHWSTTAQAPWMYNPGTHAFFSYDDPRSMAIKAAYVKREHLRGAMFWALGQDDATASLLRTVSGLLLDSPRARP
ncbi:MAG: glycoside hydrolase family 18 protein [Vulcanimicrobiaceae bacterium]